MKQIHDIQLAILRKLLFSPKARYTDLKPEKSMDNNKFDFHLKKLIDLGYLKKIDDHYEFTAAGKEYAGRIDTDNTKIIRQAKIGMFLCGMRDTGDELEFLFYTRLKHPFYGCQGSPSGKLAYGESVIEGAKREFKEETNLDGNPEIIGIHHYIVKDPETKETVEDKIIFRCRIMNPTGDLLSNEEGEFYWVKESEVDTVVTKPFVPMEQFKKETRDYVDFDGVVRFEEVIHYADNF